jgi:hypothetical protein
MLELPQGRVRLGGRELRELRRLAQQRLPHPDPAVRRRAVAWARRPARSVGRTVAVVVTGTLGGAALLVGAYARTGTLILLCGLPLTLVAVAVAAGPLHGALIHRVNLSALLDTLVVQAQPLEVRRGSGRGSRLRQLPAFGVLAANTVVGAAARVYSVVLFCLILFVLAVVWGRRSQVTPTLPLRLEETGVRLSGVDAHVPWARVSQVELTSSADPHLLGVVWRLPESAAESSRVPPGPGRQAKSSGDRLVLWLDPRDHPPEQIVLTSRAYLAANPPAVDEPGW